MTDKRATAKRYLKHYFSLIFQATGLQFVPDVQAELDDLVDLLIDAAKDELKREQEAPKGDG